MATLVLGRSVAALPCRAARRLKFTAPCARLAFNPAVRSFAAHTRTLEKKYTEDHEWIELDSNGKIGTIGISAYAANALGEVVYVELPTLNQEVAKGDSIGAVESVKSASDIMTPVSGKIIEANNVLENAAGTINKSPEADGWLAKIELSDTTELEGLMDAAKYQAFTEDADSK